MKHKRQTLSKQSDDGDDKDSVTSEGGKSGKMSSDKFLDNELSKKSCQGCEMPNVTGCGPHDDIPDIGSSRGNNNNTPTATNNNSTNFNTNSNGASSITSSGSFDKLHTEEDSRSDESSSIHTSRSSKKQRNIAIKLEEKSPSDRSILCKISPGKLGDKRSLTPSSAPGTPSVMQSPLGLPQTNIYPRSSPTTSGTTIASATVTIQNVPNQTPPTTFPTRNVGSFPHEYRKIPNMTNFPVVQNQMGYEETYNPETTQLMPEEQQAYIRNQLHNPRRSRQNFAQQYHQNYYANYKSHNPSTTDNAAYAVNHCMNNYNPYTTTSTDHDTNTYNTHYGYNPNVTGLYNNTPTDAEHLGHNSTSYYPNEIMQKTEFPKQGMNYYDGNVYGQSGHDQAHYGQTAEFRTAGRTVPPAASVPVGPIVPPGTNNVHQTDQGDHYNSFSQYYGTATEVPTVAPQNTVNGGENSNSSSDFNFLSNLANDFAPEYYQLS